MTEHQQQLRRVCGWNRQLARENSWLRAELHRAQQEIEELEAAGVARAVEAEAAESLLHGAFTIARRARR